MSNITSYTKPVRGLVAAVGVDGIIGVNSGIPWTCPEDLKWFQQLTTGGVVVMGRKTFASLPLKFKPLPGRQNVIYTRWTPTNAYGNEARLKQLSEYLTQDVAPEDKPDLQNRIVEANVQYSRYVYPPILEEIPSIKNKPIWYIGGAELYKNVIDHVDVMFITEITSPLSYSSGEIVRFPEIDLNSWNRYHLGPCGPEGNKYLYIRR